MEDVEIDVIGRKKPSSSIIVRDAYKRYGQSNFILDGLNLTVPEGTIYGFLGPSGCGKTTLLNCIVGRCELNSGSIKISAKRRSDIGFMPQEISLYGDLTVFENFLFFGYLAGMTKEDVEARMNDLVSFLEIPSNDRLANSMSGGQQRRLSIAVTLLHDPKIIILDEPTVGIDPILCHQIWQMLFVLSERGKSIIITTHYIQEAQQAHTIGLMREGKLLAEENPLVLLEQYQTDNLENVFLKLIFEEQKVNGNQSKSSYNRKKWSIRGLKPSARVVNVRFEGDDRICSRKILKALTYKNLIVMKRGYIHLMFTLLFPLIQTYVFNIAIGAKPQDLPIGVLNNEISLRHCYPNVYSGCFFEQNITFASSCLLLKYLKEEKYKILSYHDENKAQQDLRSSDIRAVLRFPRNYTIAISEKISKGMLHNFTGSILDGFVDVWLDNSNRLVEDFVKYDIMRSLVLFLKSVIIQCGKNPGVTGSPIVFQKPIRGDVDATLNSYVSTALLFIGGFFFASSSTTLFFITEKVGGQVERILICGVTVFEVVLALILFQTALSFLQATLSMLINFLPFDNPLEGNFLTFYSLLLLVTCSGVFSGVLLGIICPNVTAAAYSGVGSSFILSVTSGLFGIRESQHKILQFVSAILPATWEVEAGRKLANRGSTFTHPDVLRGFGSTIIWTGIFFTAIWYFTKYKSSSLASHK